MFEIVGRVGRRAMAENQLALHEQAQGGLQFRIRPAGDGRKQVVAEGTADHRAKLGDFLDRGEAIEPRHQRVLYRRGDRQRAHLPADLVTGVGL